MPEQKSKRLIAAEEKAARIAAEEKAKAEMRDALDSVKAAIEAFLADEEADISTVREAWSRMSMRRPGGRRPETASPRS